MATEIKVPTLGESVTSATVARWMKHAGDTVAADEPLVELETDKVTVEVNAPEAGVLASIAADEGSEVEIGALLGVVEANGAGAGATPKPATPATASAPGKPQESVKGEAAEAEAVRAEPAKAGPSKAEAAEAEAAKPGPGRPETAKPERAKPEPATASPGQPVEGQPARGQPAARPAAGVNPPPLPRGPVSRPATPPADVAMHAPLPAAAKLMQERKVSTEEVGAGSGKDGRITKGDVIAFLNRPAPKPIEAPPPPPRVADAREERVKMTRLRRTIAARLKEAQNTAAMLTTFNEVDMSAVMALRGEYREAFEKKYRGVRLGFMSFFIKACIAALREFPAVNAEIDGDEIVYKNFVHLGIAVGGSTGLVVPVIRDADRMSFAELERAVSEFGRRARDGSLKLEELTGGTFSITNGGIYGSLMSTPILNPPQSAILGMHKIEERPVAIAGKVEIRPMMYLALSYDHRIVDGREAVSFLVRVKEGVEDPRRLLLEV